jgi:hypothetical protein
MWIELQEFSSFWLLFMSVLVYNKKSDCCYVLMPELFSGSVHSRNRSVYLCHFWEFCCSRSLWTYDRWLAWWGTTARWISAASSLLGTPTTQAGLRLIKAVDNSVDIYRIDLLGLAYSAWFFYALLALAWIDYASPWIESDLIECFALVLTLRRCWVELQRSCVDCVPVLCGS